MGYIVKYTKEDPIKYISHLDLMRLIQRAIRRASIPIAYSGGFSPHPLISFASALAVGVTSQGEYLDITLEEYMKPEILRSRINAYLPRGIQFMEIKKAKNQYPSLMSLIERAEYLFEIRDFRGRQVNIHPFIEEFLSQREIYVIRRTKKGKRRIDIRPMIHQLDLASNMEEDFILKANISSGSKANLRPDLLINALIEYMDPHMKEDIYYKIHRLDLFFNKNGEWVTPMEIG